MFTYRIDLPNNAYTIIQADYFLIEHDTLGNTDVRFYVNSHAVIPDGIVNRGVLVGYVRNPVVVRFTDSFYVEPPTQEPERAEYPLDRNYAGL